MIGVGRLLTLLRPPAVKRGASPGSVDVDGGFAAALGVAVVARAGEDAAPPVGTSPGAASPVDDGVPTASSPGPADPAPATPARDTRPAAIGSAAAVTQPATTGTATPAMRAATPAAPGFRVTREEEAAAVPVAGSAPAAASDAPPAIPIRPPGGLDLQQLLGSAARLPGAEVGPLPAPIAPETSAAESGAAAQRGAAAMTALADAPLPGAAAAALATAPPLRAGTTAAVTRPVSGRGTKSAPLPGAATKSAPGASPVTRTAPAEPLAARAVAPEASTGDEGGMPTPRDPNLRGAVVAPPGPDPRSAAARPDDAAGTARSPESSARGRRAPAATVSREDAAAQEEAPVAKSRPSAPYAAPAGEELRAPRSVADERPAAAATGRPLSSTETGAETARPASFVTIPFSDEQGEAGRLRVSVLGSSVHATILTGDPQLAERLNRDLGDLRRSLADRGYGAAQVNVRTPSAGSGAAPRDLGRDGERAPREDRGESGSRRDERDPQRSHDRSRRPSQHPDPGGEKP